MTFHRTTGRETINNPYQTQRIWTAPIMAAILGFIPLLDLRLSIPIKSGKAAKVVPKPATKPTTSDLRQSEFIRLSGPHLPRDLTRFSWGKWLRLRA
jgi:hypothetical protein